MPASTHNINNDKEKPGNFWGNIMPMEENASALSNFYASYNPYENDTLISQNSEINIDSLSNFFHHIIHRDMVNG